MAQIYNSDLSKELTEGAKIQVSRDAVPNQLAEKVVPVMEVNPKMLRRIDTIRNASSTSSGSTIIFSVPSDKDFYLMGGHLNITKDAVSDNILCTISIVQNGATRVLFEIRSQTTTAQTILQEKDFNLPIKVDRGSNIVMAGSFTAGALTKGAVIYGYSVENIGA